MKKKFFYSILLTVFLIPLSQFLSTRLLILTVIISFFFTDNLTTRLSGLPKLGWDIIVYLIVLAFGLLYSENINTGLRVLETNFSFLVIPVIFSALDKIDENRRDKVLYFFLFGLLAACLICLTNAIVDYTQNQNIHVFFSNQLTDIIHSQPTYLAYYLILAITFLLYLLYYKKSKWNPLLLVLTTAFLFLMLMLTGGRTTFISVLLIFSFFALKFLTDEKSLSSKLTFGIVIIMTVCMFIVNATAQDEKNSDWSDSWDRLVLWESAVNATTDSIWGVGTGDYKEVLNDYYRKHNLTEFATDSYNSHNQFLQILLTNGVLGLIAVMLLICRPLYLSVKHQDVLGTLVFFPFLIYGMTEVFLGRYQGIVFFVFLHQTFLSYYSSLRASLMPLKGV